jgi:hypothetical protein
MNCTSVVLSGGVLTVDGTLNISGAGGCFTISGGTFTAPPTATGMVIFSGGLQNVPALTYYNLNIAGFGNKTMLGNVTVYNILTLTSNNLIVGANTLQLGGATYGNGITQTSGKITIAATSNLTWGGGTYNYTLGSLLSNAAPWTINNWTMLRNLATITLNGNLTVNGAFALNAGEVWINGNLLTLNGVVSGNINGQVRGSATSDITIGGTGAAAIYFDLGSTGIGGYNTIRNFTLNRTSNTFYPLSSLRIGGTLSLAASSTFSVGNGSGTLNTLTFDGAGTSWTGTGKFIGSGSLTGAYIYVYGSGALTTPLSFNTALAANYTLTGLSINRSGSPTLQLGTNLNILSNIEMSTIGTYGDLDTKGFVIDLGANGVLWNESSVNRIWCSTCGVNNTTSYIRAIVTSLDASTTYTGISGPPRQTGYRGLGLDLTTTAMAPGLTNITRGFSERSGNELTKSVLRYFEISPTTNAGLNATMTFHYWDSETNGLLEPDMGLYRDTTGSNIWVDRGGVSTPGAGDNTVSLASIARFSPWTAGKTNIPLPVELLKFSSKCKPQEIELNWATATETNNEIFIIERSSDNSKWATIGSVRGAGFSNQTISYTFSDENPLETISYYRLKQIDFDGAFKYYGPIAANCSAEASDVFVIIAPNPAQENVWIETNIKTPGTITLTDATGRAIAKYNSDNLAVPFNLPLQNVYPGVYLIRIDAEGFSKNYKIIRQ